MTLLAQRWDKVVDFGSPMTAWTPEMLAQHREKTMTKLEVLRAHVRDREHESLGDLLDELVGLLEQSLRALDEDEFPALRQQIREVLSK